MRLLAGTEVAVSGVGWITLPRDLQRRTWWIRTCIVRIRLSRSWGYVALPTAWEFSDYAVTRCLALERSVGKIFLSEETAVGGAEDFPPGGSPCRFSRGRGGGGFSPRSNPAGTSPPGGNCGAEDFFLFFRGKPLPVFRRWRVAPGCRRPTCTK